MRFSQQRETIKKIIYSTNSHPTAESIFYQAKEIIPNISLGTIYRNLKQLGEQGIIITINDGAATRYDWNKKPHYHFKCIDCGDLIDIEPFELDIEKKVKEKYKFEVNEVELTINGKCKKSGRFLQIES